MAKEKRKLQHCVHETTSPTSLLLSLAPEIRFMIWQALISMVPILLIGRAYTTGEPIKVRSLGSVALPPTYIKGRCTNLHQDPHSKSSSKSSRSSKKAKASSPLSWLFTNKQIYTEAQTILYANLKLHICNSMVFSAFLSQPPQSILRPSLIRSLSFCLKMTIRSDSRDGFSVASEASHGWETHYPFCHCPDCFSLSSLPPGASNQLPELRELKLLIYFRCKRGQGNLRPVLGHFANGRPRKGLLYRPKNPSPLVCVDDSEKIKKFCRRFCDQRPLRIFRGRMIKSVDVKFCTERIEHDPRNHCPNVADRCWCIRRSIDEESLQRSGIARLIEKRIMDGVP